MIDAQLIYSCVDEKINDHEILCLSELGKTFMQMTIDDKIWKDYKGFAYTILFDKSGFMNLRGLNDGNKQQN